MEIKKNKKIIRIYKFKEMPYLIKELEWEEKELPSDNISKINCLKSLKKFCKEQEISKNEKTNCKILEEINRKIEEYEKMK